LTILEDTNGSPTNMSTTSRPSAGLPHPSWNHAPDKSALLTSEFVRFEKEEINQSIGDRFEQRVHKHPSNIAVKTRNQSVTYSELNKSANRIGRGILAQSRNEAKPVALLLEKNAAMIASMLGVLKAARVYVPLDPAHPRARLLQILDDSETELLITDNKHLPTAKGLEHSTRQVLNVDQVDSSISSDDIGLSVSPDAACYIIYTSGSTGEPKGVVQTHRNVLHNTMWHTNSLHLCAQDRLTLLASGATGQAVTDIYGATLNGATLHPFDIREDGLTWLASRLIENEITIYHSSTSVFRAFVDSLSGDEDFSRIRLIKLGGEPVSRKELDSFKKHFPAECKLVNTLSATETGAIRQHMMDASATISGEIAPVGLPVDDKRLLLLNDAGEEVELGSVGEICIESAYLARGYWRKPELTAAAFSVSPSAKGVRIYRSGDLGRMDGSGHLTYLGRRDSRLKIRGYTVEIAEIEAALRGIKGISEAAVVAHDYGIERRIAAYFIPERGIELSAGTLRKHMATVLPGFMIPSAFVYLESMPRTPNGKVDRRALPPPETSRPKLDADFIAPRTALEEKVAAIWVDVLGISPIGVRDNFFDLGGNSLMAAQVLSRLYRVFGSDVSMRNFFESPTVAAVVLTVVQNKAERISGANITRILDELAPSSSDAAIIGRDETKRTYTGRAE